VEKITKGFKVTDKDMKCQRFQFVLGERHTQKGNLVFCQNGFHFCEKLSHCFNYYEFSKENRVFEVEAHGDTVTDGNKSAALNISLVRELTWEEVLKLANEGADNTGHSNTGNWNTGNRNTGNWNTGNRNTGNRNTGYSNTGNWNTGNWNTGYRNTGNRNTGNWNTGNRNTGYSNTGNRNTGYSNTGDWNTGNCNTGDWNTGNWNTGNRNTGNWNTGNRNTGYSNTGDRNTGAFCTKDAPFPMFNKPSKWTEKDFMKSKAYSLLANCVDTKLWVPASAMTDAEKAANRGWATAEGYIKDIPFKEAFQNAWHNFSAENKKAFTSLPNFSKKVFFDITGVKVD
jgi:hypothetical protein